MALTDLAPVQRQCMSVKCYLRGLNTEWIIVYARDDDDNNNNKNNTD